MFLCFELDTFFKDFVTHTHTLSNDTKVEILNKLLYKTHPLTNTFITFKNTHTHGGTLTIHTGFIQRKRK